MNKGSFTIIFLLGLIFVLSGCSFDLKKIDEKIGEGFKKLENFKNLPDEEVELKPSKPEDKPIFDRENLSKEEEKMIDDWINKKGLNRYGDSEGTFYTGGTPLFNEATGESLDRYQYIFDNHPEMLNELD